MRGGATRNATASGSRRRRPQRAQDVGRTVDEYVRTLPGPHQRGARGPTSGARTLGRRPGKCAKLTFDPASGAPERPLADGARGTVTREDRGERRRRGGEGEVDHVRRRRTATFAPATAAGRLRSPSTYTVTERAGRKHQAERQLQGHVDRRRRREGTWTQKTRADPDACYVSGRRGSSYTDQSRSTDSPPSERARRAPRRRTRRRTTRRRTRSRRRSATSATRTGRSAGRSSRRGSVLKTARVQRLQRSTATRRPSVVLSAHVRRLPADRGGRSTSPVAIGASPVAALQLRRD